MATIAPVPAPMPFVQNKLVVRTITFNLGDTDTSTTAWQKYFSDPNPQSFTAWTNALLDNEADVVIVTVQEDFSKSGFGEALRKYMETQQFTLLEQTESDWGNVEGKLIETLFRKNHFSVKLFLFGRRSTVTKSEEGNRSKTVCLKTHPCRKAAVGARVHLTRPFPLSLVAVGAHFPMKSKSVDMGYTDRVDALQTTETQVVEPLVRDNSSKTPTFVVLAGDLNFRIETGQDPKDQLQKLLASRKEMEEKRAPGGILAKLGFASTPAWQEETNTLLQNSRPTCKLDLKMRSCRTAKALVDLERGHKFDLCYKTKTEKGDRRVPSYCDRVLYSRKFLNNQVGVEVRAYKSFTAPGVEKSDHDPVVAEFVLTRVSDTRYEK